jgi:hypothetical protein
VGNEAWGRLSKDAAGHGHARQGLEPQRRQARFVREISVGDAAFQGHKLKDAKMVHPSKDFHVLILIR